MIETDARVTAVHGDMAEVATIRQSACGSCSAKAGCGTSLLASWFPQRQLCFRLPNPIGARAGDRVVLGLDESVLQRASLLLYGLPLLGLLLGAVAGELLAARFWGISELGGVLGGLSGLIAALIAVRRVSDRNARRGAGVKLLRLTTPDFHLPAREVALPSRGHVENH